MYTRQLNGTRMMWIAALALAFLASGAGAAVYSGGTGVAGDPYQIGNAADWYTLSVTPVDWDKQFLLMEDIDFDGASLTPVGNASPAFTGFFDGDDHVLRNWEINLPAQSLLGLFGRIGLGGSINNLGVENMEVVGNEYVGALAGVNTGSVTLCHATGVISGNALVGGLIGYNNMGSVSSCYATGKVAGTNSTGGLVGGNDASVASCYTASTVFGDSGTGGLIGASSGTVTFCYTTGTVTGTASVGGLLGENVVGTVTSCYTTGSVIGTTYVGGMVGRSTSGTITSCYWDMDTSGQLTSGGGEGRTTDEMTHPYAVNTYVGWDFATVWASDTNYRVNNGYPYLLGNVPPPEEESCGCCRTTAKNLTIKELFKRTLGDWLLVGLSVLVLAAFSTTRK